MTMSDSSDRVTFQIVEHDPVENLNGVSVFDGTHYKVFSKTSTVNKVPKWPGAAL